MPSGGRTWFTITFICFHIPFLLAQARLHHSRPRHNVISQRDALSDSGLTSASWIWAPGATSGNVAFLKTFSSTPGKLAASATISITAVNQFTVWVNGQPVGASSDWTSPQVLSAALNQSSNTFSVLAVNSANADAPPPGLLAAIKIQYSDNSADTVVSDSSWQASVNIPSDFPVPSDTSHFTSATVAGQFGSGAWGSSLTLASADPNAPSLSGGTWIWSTSDAQYAAPAGTVGFRKTVATPSGKSAQSATVILGTDNIFVLYVNSKYVGASPAQPNAVAESTAWGRAHQVTVGLNAASNTFTVIVQNILDPSTGATTPGGLIAAISIRYTDGSSDLLRTDPSWLNGPVTGAPAFLATADSALAGSFNLVAFGAWPWYSLLGIDNVLAAADVPSSPFNGAVAASNSGSGGGTGAGGSGGVGTSSAAGGGPTQGSSTRVTGASALGAGPSGSLGGSTVASAVRSGSGVTASTETANAANAANAGSGTGTGTATPSSPTSGTSSSSTRAPVPIAAILGAVFSGLALIVIPLAIFRWRRRRQTIQRRSSQSSITPFAANAANSQSGSSPSRTSLGSVRPAEMAELQPQRLRNVNSNISRLPADVASEPPRPGIPPQSVIPLTKLERENMMWGNAGASERDLTPHDVTASSSNSQNASGTAVGTGGTLGPLETPRPGTVYGDSDPETDTLPPPSYYAE
ncbi:hypothetical protein FB451DRAFT_140486 [Mycena latifolia]|nr:hypothetical protein FB451DRAFT_140486 [Mycena latifolia]